MHKTSRAWSGLAGWAIGFASASLALAQLAPPANGPRRADPTWVAIHDATVHVDAAQTLAHATVVMRDGVILAVMPGDAGPDGKAGTEDDVAARLPLGPRVIDGRGLHVYPALIDAYVEVDAPRPPSRESGNASAHWNELVTPQRSALDGPGLDDKTGKALREMGFGAVAISPKGGVVRGWSSVVSTMKPFDDPSLERPRIYRDRAYQSLSFETASDESETYPSSQMGAIALLRQTLSDATWAFGASADESNTASTSASDAPSCLEHLGAAALRGRSMLLDTRSELEALRAAKIVREYREWTGHEPSAGALLLGCGTEFARLDAIKQDGLSFVLPLNFPKAPDVSSPDKANSVELRDMMTWEQAPTNPRRLAQAGVTFALTTSKLKDRSDFFARVRTALAHGLREEQALAALTNVPAKLLGVDDQLGTIDAGKRANLILATGPLFAKKTKLRSLFIDGHQHVLSVEKPDLAGTWTIDLKGPDAATRGLEISDDGDVVVTKTTGDGKDAATVKAKARKVVQEGTRLSFVFDHDDFGAPGAAGVALVFDVSDPNRATATGRVLLPDGRELPFSAERSPREMAGVWPTFFPPQAFFDAKPGLVLVFDKEGALTFRDENQFEKTLNLTPDNLVRDALGVRYDLGLASELGGRVRVEMTPDFATDGKAQDAPPTARGVVVTQRGDRFTFTSARRNANPFLGRWRVIEADAAPVAPDAREQVLLDIRAKKITVTITTTGASAGERSTEAQDPSFDAGTLTFSHSLSDLGIDAFGKDGVSKDSVVIRFSPEGPAKDTLEGTSTLPDGSTHRYRAVRQASDASDSDEDDARLARDVPDKLPMPFGPYGYSEGAVPRPTQRPVVIDNATLWTNTDAGIIERGALVIDEGRIVYAGKSPAPGPIPTGALVLDGRGKHVTPGIIDAHSHTGISRGVNEGGQAVTSEVRISDVTNSDDVNWYRQLAGGVTTVLQLHGSANAIGGQSQTTKLRWGAARPDDMHLEGAIPGIKFALGENPRQVNWGLPDNRRTRYPQTRMGVETLIRDRFTAAREYAMDANPHKRRDVELEPLAEILAGKRLIHCHSYRQDEMVMLAQVAKDFGITLGTYQHALEAYKVADIVRDATKSATTGGGASGFADWWGYKVEVQDAIPAAFPLMEKVGVVVSFNSDSNSLARLLNVEAGKAVKYGREVGGVLPVDALKYVTLNPAKQLRIDTRVGKLAAGLDADVAVWSGSPLSTMSRCERTFVDGRELFSLEQDAAFRAWHAKERQRLITKLLADAKAKKDKTPAKTSEAKGDADAKESDPQPPSGMSDEALARLRARNLELLRSGRDIFSSPGVCGCGVVHE